MRQAGDVTYADAHNEIRGEGIVEFASKKDMEKALDMLDGCEFNGKQITLIREKDRRYISGFSTLSARIDVMKNWETHQN